MDERVEHLEEHGLLKRQAGRMVFARRMLSRLRRAELDKVAEQMSNQTGMAHTPSGEGEYVQGTYSKRLDLASGRYAVIEGINEHGKSFELVPWKPSLDKQIGKQVQGQIMSAGRVDWQIGWQRGLER